MRSVIRGSVIADTALTNIIPAAQWIDASAVLDKPPHRPFAVFRYGEMQHVAKPGAFHLLRVWVHDEAGSYAQIEKVLDLLRANLERVHDKQSKILCIEWQSNGEDLSDPTYNTIFKVATFRIVTTT
jgi:hypothetical protein